MEDEGKQQTKRNDWPQVKFMFSVKFGDAEAFFEEVTGLNSETQQIEYRAGDSKIFSTVKMPGIKKYGNITLKKGIFKDDKGFWELYKQVNSNAAERQTVTISLLDEKQGVAMSWKLTNAFPAKMTAPSLNAEGNDVAVETIELAHEGLDIAK